MINIALPINFFDIFIIFLSFTISFYWLHIPLTFISNKLKFKSDYYLTIPLSLSFQILIGYLFYSIKFIRIFPYVFVIFAVVLNLLFMIRNFSELTEKIKNVKFDPIIIISSISLLFSRLYFAFTNYGPIHPDTIYHLQYLQNLEQYRVLPLTYYAPGFHLITYPLYLIINPESIIRYAGPILSIFIIFSIYLSIRSVLLKKYSMVLLIILSTLSIFDLFFLQTIIFWPSSLSYLLILSILLLANSDFSSKIRNIFLLATTLSLSITVPYIYIQIIFTFVLLLIFFIFTNNKDHLKRSLVLFFLLATGFLFSYFHIFLQKNIWGTGGFPIIKSEVIVNNTKVTTNNFSNDSKLISKLHIPQQIIPQFNTFLDLLRYKENSPLFLLIFSKTGYWMLINIALLFYLTIYKKRSNFFDYTVVFINIIFSFIALSGLFELSYYRGRTGTYVLLFIIISVPYFIDRLFTFNLKYNRIILYTSVSMLILIFTHPILPLGHVCSDTINVVHSISSVSHNSIILTNNTDMIKQIYPNLTIIELSKENINKYQNNNIDTYAILEEPRCSSLPPEFNKKLNIDTPLLNKDEFENLLINFDTLYINDNIEVFKKNI